jgi:hypothetical protein
MNAPNAWITYRTRFLIKAKPLHSNLTFTDVLGRQHSGRKGDYLVESSDGILRIVPRQIFQDIYVPLGVEPEETSVPLSLPPQLTRKCPQPDRTRRFPTSSLSSL